MMLTTGPPRRSVARQRPRRPSRPVPNLARRDPSGPEHATANLRARPRVEAQRTLAPAPQSAEASSTDGSAMSGGNHRVRVAASSTSGSPSCRAAVRILAVAARLDARSCRLSCRTMNAIGLLCPTRSQWAEVVLRFGDMPTSKALRQWLAAASAADRRSWFGAGNEPTASADVMRVDRAGRARWRPNPPDGTDAEWSKGWRAADDAAAAAIGPSAA